MSIAFLITSATTSNFHPLYNENKSNFPRTKLGFVHKYDSLESSVLKIETNPKSRFFLSAQAIVHNICKCCVGFSSVAAKCGAASSFDLNTSGFGDYEGTVDLEMTEAVSLAGSDPAIGNGSGHGNGDSGGGGHDSGSGGGGGGGGLDESAGWEGVKWWCWWLFEAWKNYNQLGIYSSAVTFSRLIMPIIVGPMIDPELEAILMPLLMALFLPIFVLPVAAFTGFMAAMELLALWFAIGVLGCVVAIMLLLFFEFSQHHNL